MSRSYVPDWYTKQAVSMKVTLFIDSRSKTVVHAEAGKPFVDWLFQMLNIPVPWAVLIGLAKTRQLNGSLGNLLTSIQSLVNNRHILTNNTNFLKPIHRVSCSTRNTCTRGGHGARALCPHCRPRTSTKMGYVSAPMVKEGLYMVTDDLVVKPITAKCIATLSKIPGPNLGIEERVLVEERVVVIGENDAVKLIDAAFMSKKVFTDVFVSGRPSSIKLFNFFPPPAGGMICNVCEKIKEGKEGCEDETERE